MSNPCRPGGCPIGDLAGAYLSDNPGNAQDFLGDADGQETVESSLLVSSTIPSGLSVSRSTASVSSTPTPNAIGVPSKPSNEHIATSHHDHSLGTGSIIGIVLGALAFLAVIAALLYLWRQTNKLNKNIEGVAQAPPQQPQQDEKTKLMAPAPEMNYPGKSYSDTCYSARSPSK
jgi:hypothetical protein